MTKHTAAALQVYRRRNKVLKGLGFESYDEYLASPLWREIHERKLESEGQRCFACGKAANQVHHGDYERLTLLPPLPGSEKAWEIWLAVVELYAVCEKDHHWAEHFLGEIVGPALATRRLKNRRRKNKLDEAVPRAARQGKQEKRVREMESELNRLLERDDDGPLLP